MRIIYIILFCLITHIVYGQENAPRPLKVNNIQDAMDQHLVNFRKYNPQINNIFVVTKLDEQIYLPEKVLKVENGIDAKILKKKDKNYLVEVRLASQLNYLKIDIVN